VSSVICHAAPAKVKIASLAIHMRTAAILFDAYFAFGAFAHIFSKEKTP